MREWKTLSVDKSIYQLVKDKQSRLIEENDFNNIEIGVVTEVAILNGLDKVDIDNIIKRNKLL